MSGHLPEVSLLEAALDHTADLHPEAAAHLAACASCSRRVQELIEDLATITTQQTVAPPPALRERILAATGEPEGAPFAGFARRLGRMFDLEPAQAEKILVDAHGDTAWELWGPFSYFHFAPGKSLQSGAEAGIVRLEPGVRFPRHRHRGDEYALVLRGILREDLSGRESLPGDVLHMAEGTRHTVTCTSTGRCVFAVLLHGGMPVME
jgi:putative transcriptional regulator